ncbi:50S ribosome-binding GTPase [Candidatus Sumerlaeota bacterium]|nr:50S ribosome-binding GTPase [Candidatus Sumerlaeota bacterium]
MPANLTPEYINAEQAFRKAKTDDERLSCLEEMLRTIPKHKGTERMQGDIKRRIAKIKLASEKKGGKKGFTHHVDKEGSGQIVLLGGPNTGKSQILKALTNAEPEIAPYPFTTAVPMPGMMRYEDIQIQLIDLPPFSPDHTESWLPELARGADGALLIVDLAGFPLQDIDFILERLDQVKLKLVREPDPSQPFNVSQKRTILVGNRIDLPGSQETFDILRELYGDRYDTTAVSAKEGTGMNELKKLIFDMLHIIRIYPKEPGKPVDRSTPFTVPENSALLDFARVVHKDFLNLKFARVWGKSAKFQGQTITREQALHDGDIVELHL